LTLVSISEMPNQRLLFFLIFLLSLWSIWRLVKNQF
jgi:hypothetical protein